MGTASVTVRVYAVAPTVDLVNAPAKIAARARTMVIRIASTEPATLTDGRLRVQVGKTPRRVRVPLRIGRDAAEADLRLTAYRKRSSYVVGVKR